ncbi:MAG: VOC family protein [Chloroflexi bacterium]|nr:VOC family protein [Chloroflexota bacterium]
MRPSIHPDTTLGFVRIAVSDLQRALDFYQNTLGFKLHRREGNHARLGAGENDLLVLDELPNARRVNRATGLYHFAMRVPSRVALAHALKQLADTNAPLQGFADHLVSEAIYLADPDGNGIEIYRDRPRDEWRDARGNLKMGTEPLDVRGVLDELKNNGAPWHGLERGTVLGHMHLKVAHIADAEEFYCGILGFDFIMRYGPAALFVSAGGYHHHIGLNTWESAGAPPLPSDALGLREFVVRVPNRAELDPVIERAQKAGIAIRETDAGFVVRDPSQNEIALTTQSGESK